LLRSTQDGRLLRLTLDRAAKRNALNLELCLTLAQAVADAKPSDTGCILLDAEGPSFCAGMDLGESTSVDPDVLAQAHERLFTMNHWSPVPIVASVQGHALAGGTGLVAQAHIVVAQDGAQFGLTEVRVGMWPMLVYRSVEEAIGARKTLEWSLTGRSIFAAEAQAAGLVHEIAPVDRADAIAREIASRSADAIDYGMRYYRASRGLAFVEAGAVAAKLRKELMSTPGYIQAASKFKR
jgi:enoyl-CoA hydratase/carnithine racemase